MELPISSVDQSPVIMGKMAGQVFIESVKENNSGVSTEKKVVLAPQLYIKKSSKRKSFKFTEIQRWIWIINLCIFT